MGVSHNVTSNIFTCIQCFSENVIREFVQRLLPLLIRRILQKFTERFLHKLSKKLLPDFDSRYLKNWFRFFQDFLRNYYKDSFEDSLLKKMILPGTHLTILALYSEIASAIPPGTFFYFFLLSFRIVLLLQQ